MEYPSTSDVNLLPFSIVYENNIKRRLEDIDIFIKSQQPPYNELQVCTLLDIKSYELNTIMTKYNLNTLNKFSFFRVVLSSSSEICKLIQREFTTGLSSYYTPEEISYIYNLNIDTVISAIDLTGFSHINSSNLIDVFKYIYVPISRYNQDY